MLEPLRNALGLLSRPARRGDAVILMYHRIAPPDVAGGGVAVSPAHFEQHLQALGERFMPLHLSNLVAQQMSGGPQKGSVAVTFDDGYAATVFVVSGYIGSGRRFWWDELERICLSPPSLPARLELRIEAETRIWETSTSERRPLYRELRKRLGALEDCEREELLQRLRAWAGLESIRTVETLGEDELRALAAGDLVEIGAHTVTHPRLPAISSERQLEEIRSSRQQLSALLGRNVSLFSYPFGAHDRVSVACARKAGVTCACTTEDGAVRSSTDPHRLPRIYVGDWQADELVERVVARLA
jgi:peptidoglycan/xylan/chitin deacetylase (PgdA/CDA1 family)